MADVDEAEAAARAAKLQALQDQVTDAGNNVRALKVREPENTGEELCEKGAGPPRSAEQQYRKQTLLFFFPLPSGG